MDVVFDPSPLTDKEKKMISEFIKLDKAKRLRKGKPKTSSVKSIYS
jgi:hypothetical protein